MRSYIFRNSELEEAEKNVLLPSLSKTSLIAIRSSEAYLKIVNGDPDDFFRITTEEIITEHLGETKASLTFVIGPVHFEVKQSEIFIKNEQYCKEHGSIIEHDDNGFFTVKDYEGLRHMHMLYGRFDSLLSLEKSLEKLFQGYSQYTLPLSGYCDHTGVVAVKVGYKHD